MTNIACAAEVPVSGPTEGYRAPGASPLLHRITVERTRREVARLEVDPDEKGSKARVLAKQLGKW